MDPTRQVLDQSIEDQLESSRPEDKSIRQRL